MRYFLLLISFVFSTFQLHAQESVCDFSSKTLRLEQIFQHHLEEENLDSIQFLHDDLLNKGDNIAKGLSLFFLGESLIFKDEIQEAIITFESAHKQLLDADCPNYAAISLGKLGDLQLSERNYEEANKHYNALIQLAEKYQLNDNYVEALLQKANLQEIENQPKAAQQSLQKAAIVAQKSENYKQLQSIYTASATQYQATGVIDSAVIAYKKLIHYDSLEKDNLSLLTDFATLSNLLKLQGDFGVAQVYFFKALSIAEIENDSLAMMNIYSDVGEVYLAQKIYPKARQYSQQSLDLAMREDIKMLQAKNYKTLAYIEESQNNPKVAISYFQQALTIYKKLRNKQNISEIQLRLATTYKKGEALQEAQSLLEETIEVKKEIKDEIGLVVAQNTLAEIFYEQKKHKESLNLLNESLKTAKALNNKEGLLNAYKLLADNHEQLSQFQEALAFQKDYQKLSASISSAQNLQIIDNISTKYESEKKEKALVAKEAELNKQEVVLYRRNNQITVLLGGLLAIFLATFLLIFKNSQVKKEKQKSDELLLNILPANIAQELKETGRAKAKRHENVTVLFSDFKDFVKISGTMSPENLVKEVDFCFSMFDEIMERHNLEKIKTIGDAYMCIGGIGSSTNAPTNMIKAAVDMQTFLQKTAQQRKAENLPFFEARIGIHTGSVVAGIVGSKKFAYDVWGDTVNTASRMESASEVGQINISEATYQLVKTDFNCESRGKITVKNKGEVEMYFVKYDGG